MKWVRLELRKKEEIDICVGKELSKLSVNLLWIFVVINAERCMRLVRADETAHETLQTMFLIRIFDRLK